MQTRKLKAHNSEEHLALAIETLKSWQTATDEKEAENAGAEKARH
jgi:hypothetical protein